MYPEAQLRADPDSVRLTIDSNLHNSLAVKTKQNKTSLHPLLQLPDTDLQTSVWRQKTAVGHWALMRSAGGKRQRGRGFSLLPQTDPSDGVISAQHGAVQQGEVESGLLWRLRVKCVSENNVNGFRRRQIHGYFRQLD